MEFIFGFILFILACYVSFYLPGKLLLLRTFTGVSSSLATILSWPVGISLFLLGVYLFSWIHSPYFYLLVILVVLFYGWLRDRSLFALHFKNLDIWSLGIVLLGSLVFLSLMAFSYVTTQKGIQFVGTINVIDGLLHIAYTKNLLTNFPPTHAGLANVPLRGYHYFYDLLVSRLVLLYHFSPVDLYYRYLPLLISLLYGAGFYTLTSVLTRNVLSRRLVLFFAYFAQSFAFILSFFIHSIMPTQEMGSIYPLELILNPAIILSVGMLLFATYFLLAAKPTVKQMILVGFLFGIITELKVYTGIIGIVTFAIILFFRAMQKRHAILSYALGFLTTAIVVAITYIPNNFGAGSLWYSPFFVYSVYMQEPPFASWNWELQRIIFRDHHNILHILFLYVEAFGLFWLLSLGSRIVLLLGIPWVLKLSFWKNEKNIAVASLVVVPVIIGSLFVQSISIFDTKQFFWIAGALMAIPAGVALGSVVSFAWKPLRIFVIVGIILLSWGGVVGQLNAFLFHPQRLLLSKEDAGFLTSIGETLPGNSFLVYVPDTASYLGQPPYSISPVIAALTGHATYFEPESTQFDLKPIYNERKDVIAKLQAAIENCNKNGIRSEMKKAGSPYLITGIKSRCLETTASRIKTDTDNLALYRIQP